MNDDYLSYWGLSRPPFALTPDPEMLFLSGQHSECLMRLKYAIFSHKGGALLVSDNAGNGKTTVLARLKNDLNDYYGGRVKVVFIDHPTLSPIEMIGEIGHQLGTELETTEKIKALNALRDRLFDFYNQNIKVIVIVDEGQMLKDRPDILGELRILLNFCVADAFLLTFIFSGQKPLDSILREMPEFWQRLPVRYFLKNLNFNDTRDLVRFRLGRVGAAEEIFKEEAFDGIYNYSQGCPRVICSVADLCLVVGFAKGVKRIGFVEVSTACRDMESSGDGFHYYAYLKSQETDAPVAQETGDAGPAAAQRPMPRPKRQPKQPSQDPAPSIAAATVNAIVCPSCTQPNDRERTYCDHCGAPLRRKCPRCLAVVETFTGECPVCHSSIDVEEARTRDEFKREMKPYDILESGYGVWLQAKNIAFSGDEAPLVILPRKSFMTPGPRVVPPLGAGEAGTRDADLIVTDRRVLIAHEGGTVAADLGRIEACSVVSSGGILSRSAVMLLTIDGGTWRISLPYGAKKSRKALDTIAAFLKTRMLS